MSTRRRARELALRVLYASELSQDPISEIIDKLLRRWDKKKDIFGFCIQLIQKTKAHTDQFDDIIKKKAFNWEFDRIAIIDRIVLRMAMCEFLYFKDIPPKVSIDEAIEIAKKYSTDKSGKFVNGILDSVLSDWKSAQKLKKTGRGLLEGNSKKSEPFRRVFSKRK